MKIEGETKIPRIETERLLLREWKDNDLAPFAAMNADPEVMEFFPKTVTENESQQFIIKANQTLSTRQFGLWAVETKDTKTFIGFIGLAVPTFEAPFMPCTEVGWRLCRSAWSKGHATEGALRVLEYAFHQLALVEVVSLTAKINVRSRKVMERIGMQRNPADDFEHPRLEVGHRLREHVLYRISRESFLDSHGRIKPTAT